MIICCGKIDKYLIFSTSDGRLSFLLLFYFTYLIGVSNGALPHASQQGILHPYRTYADITLFHFTIPPDLSRATWEFVAFMDSTNCPARDVHIYLQHGSYPVMSADNSSFPSSLYLGRTALFSTITQATFHGLGHHHVSFEHKRSIVPVYSPLPGDWFVAAFLSNWDQQLTQQGIGHKCHYSLFAVALWSTDTDVEIVTPGISTSYVAHHSFSYYKFFVPEGAQHLSVTISQCEKLVGVSITNSSSQCLSSLSLRARALPFLPSTPSYHNDPYPMAEGDVNYWGQIEENSSVSLTESHPHTDVYYYLLVVTEVQARFNILVNISECQKFDLRNGWAKLLNSGFLRKPGVLIPNETTTQGSSSRDFTVARNDSSKWLLDTNTSSDINVTTQQSVINSNQVTLNWTISEEVSQSSVEVDMTDDDIVINKTVKNDEKSSHSCLHTFQLTRIQHSQEFSSSFLLQVDEFFISSLLLPDGDPVLVRLDILPFLDIGGSLSIGLLLDRMLLTYFPSAHVLNVKACVRQGRPPSILNSHSLINCPSDMMLSLSSKDHSTMEATLIVPFPEPGSWFVAIQAECKANGSRVSCIPEEMGLDIDIRMQPCIFSGDPCGPKGECERTHHGLHTFSSCLCYGGYAGWGCTDGKGASPPSRQLVGTLSLTLSNLLFLPAVILAAKRHLYAESLIYLATTFFSILYHACDEPEYNFCVTKYEVLQFCDFFCSILAFWVTLISLAELPPQLSAAAHMAGVLVVAVGVEWNRTALIVFLVPVALGLLVPVVAWAVRSWQTHKFLILNQKAILRLLPGVLLAGLGLGLFAMVETEANYQFVHSAWHMLMGLALLFLLPENKEWKEATTPNSRRPRTTNNAPLLDATSQELCDVNDYYATNPVFVLSSTHQLLVTSES